KDRKLYVPSGFAFPESLRSAVTSETSLKKIRRGYDGLLRLIASIQSGQIRVSLALERFGSAARGDAIFDAGDALGRLLRTLFLCDYFTNEAFRRAILKILDRGERMHALQRAILAGKLAPKRGRRKEEMAVISGSHALLTNLVMAWNTHHMQTMLDGWTKEKKIIPDDGLARISPAHTGHINFPGTFTCPFEPYRDQLLRAA
ncbi:MAG: Tn3 family transposase, partial [Burkholderiales bacterium]